MRACAVVCRVHVLPTHRCVTLWVVDAQCVVPCPAWRSEGRRVHQEPPERPEVHHPDPHVGYATLPAGYGVDQQLNCRAFVHTAQTARAIVVAALKRAEAYTPELADKFDAAVRAEFGLEAAVVGSAREPGTGVGMPNLAASTCHREWPAAHIARACGGLTLVWWWLPAGQSRMSIGDDVDLSVVMVARVMDALRTRKCLPARMCVMRGATIAHVWHAWPAVVLGTAPEAAAIAQQQREADSERQNVLHEAQQQVYNRTYERDEVKSLKGKDLKSYQQKFKKVRGDCCDQMCVHC